MKCKDNKNRYLDKHYLLLMISLFITAAPLYAIQVPDTDQKECFNTTEIISCPKASEPFFGQDAHYSINSHQFVKLDASGNPLLETSASWVMVLDQTTGLIWEVKTNDNSVHDRDNMYSYYYLDEKFIKHLNQDRFGGFSDWRLPKVRELNMLADIQHDQPSIDTNFFPQTIPSDYWSATPHSENKSQGWCVSFFHGNDTIQSRQSTFHVRAVRGEIFYDPERFVDNNDGTITDTVTGFMWQKETIKGKNWTTALNDCQYLELAGYTDWRLPGREVLRSIVDYARFAPALDVRFFSQSTAAAYWSSTTDQQKMSQAWCLHFQYGNDLSRQKDQLYAIRAVRGGQNFQAGHLKISAPSPGNRLNAGMKTAIQWDSADIEGLVDIQLSKFGGIEGSFETILSGTDNDGLAEWIVSGEPSENCVIRIVPQGQKDAYADQGMFSIDHFSGAWIDAIPVNNYQTYRLMLLGQYSDHIEPVETSWLMVETPGISLSENSVSSSQNNWVKIFCRFETLTYERWIALFSSTDTTEIEPNSTKTQSLLMSAGQFYSGVIASNDLDMYKIALFFDEIIEIAFLPQTDFADYSVQIVNENGIRIYEKISVNGQSFHTELGLTEGNYYIQIASYGDVAPNDPYTLSYVSTGALPGNTPIPIEFGHTLTGRNASLVDVPKYTFSLLASDGVIIDFYPPNLSVGYQIELKNEQQTLIDQLDCLDQKQKHLEILLDKGNYSIEIVAKDQVDRSAQFKLSLNKSPFPIEKEANDTFQTATSFNLQLPVRGNLSHSTDMDIYFFEQNLPEIRLLTLADPSDGSDTWIRIFKDSDDHSVYQFQVPDGTFFSRNVGLAVGRYYLKLSPQAETIDHQYYSLELTPSNETAVEIEPDDTKGWCNALENTQWMRGMVFPETDIDRYGFHVASSGRVQLTFEPLNALAVYGVSLLDDHETILSSRSVSQSQVYTTSWMMPSGNAYVLIKGNGDYQSIGEYRLRIQSDQQLTGIKRIQSLSIMDAPQNLVAGHVYPLSAVIYFSNADIQPLTTAHWYSLDQTVASIDTDGRLTASDKGETTIIAEYQGTIAECRIGVEQLPSIEIQDYGELILVAGSHESESASRFQTTQYLANLVYTRFLERRFKHDDIFYLNAVSFHDLDKDGYDDTIVDISNPSTNAFIDIFNQIKTSGKSTGPLFIYLIGPSGNNAFEIAPDEYLSGNLLKDMLRSFYNYHHRPIVVIMESPKAGQFLDVLFLEDSHVFIAPSTVHDAHTMFDGHLSFSQFFLDRLSDGDSINEAFQQAKVSLRSLRQPFSNMAPHMLANTPESTESLWLGGDFGLTRASIDMTALNPDRTFTANEIQNIDIQVFGSDYVSAVYGLVSSPDYLVPEPVNNFAFSDTRRSSIALSRVSDTNAWKSTYEKFEYSGRYWIDICMIDTHDHLSLSHAFSFSVVNGKATDMDYDGMPDIWEDSYIGLDKTVYDSQNDLDKDGLSNLNEYLFQCDPTIVDSDQDHLTDGWEVQNNLNPIDPSDAWADADGDNVSNYQEFLDDTDPQNANSFVQHYGDIRGELYTDIVGYDAGIKGAEITLLETQDQTYSTQEGLFLFRKIPYGRYTVQVSVSHFKGYTKKIVLSQTNVFFGKIRLLYEAEQLGCDFNKNDYLDLPDIIRSLQIISNVIE
ncbi:MAG: DUF1566 domain-containing protein [Candidatus Magnetomorum sp.]|nr:DUF1566 domain-containing protein [Candidatus Magnetomorum sp.]